MPQFTNAISVQTMSLEAKLHNRKYNKEQTKK